VAARAQRLAGRQRAHGGAGGAGGGGAPPLGLFRLRKLRVEHNLLAALPPRFERLLPRPGQLGDGYTRGADTGGEGDGGEGDGEGKGGGNRDRSGDGGGGDGGEWGGRGALRELSLDHNPSLRVPPPALQAADALVAGRLWLHLVLRRARLRELRRALRKAGFEGDPRQAHAAAAAAERQAALAERVGPNDPGLADSKRGALQAADDAELVGAVDVKRLRPACEALAAHPMRALLQQKGGGEGGGGGEGEGEGEGAFEQHMPSAWALVAGPAALRLLRASDVLAFELQADAFANGGSGEGGDAPTPRQAAAAVRAGLRATAAANLAKGNSDGGGGGGGGGAGEVVGVTGAAAVGAAEEAASARLVALVGAPCSAFHSSCSSYGGDWRGGARQVVRVRVRVARGRWRARCARASANPPSLCLRWRARCARASSCGSMTRAWRCCARCSCCCRAFPATPSSARQCCASAARTGPPHSVAGAPPTPAPAPAPAPACC
jgi:hypothetical protein